MSGQDHFEQIVTTLNGAVFDDTLWPDTAGLIDKAAEATGNYLVTGDGAAPGDIDIFFARFCFGGHRNEDWEREYFEVYHPVDERLERIRKLPDAQVIHTPSLLTAEEAKTSIMHNEALPRSQSRDGLNVRLDGPRGSRIVWAIGDPVAGRGWSSAQVRTIERVLPHVRQFVRVREALLDARALGASLLELLENRHIGVIQLDDRERAGVHRPARAARESGGRGGFAPVPRQRARAARRPGTAGRHQPRAGSGAARHLAGVPEPPR